MAEPSKVVWTGSKLLNQKVGIGFALETGVSTAGFWG